MIGINIIFPYVVMVRSPTGPRERVWCQFPLIRPLSWPVHKSLRSTTVWISQRHVKHARGMQSALTFYYYFRIVYTKMVAFIGITNLLLL